MADPKKDEERENEPEEQFQLTRGWLLLGLFFVALGIGCGLVMSSATFMR